MREKENTTVKDRTLGDGWEDWDGKVDPSEIDIPGPVGRFLLFSWLFVVLFTVVIGLIYYMIYPRLESLGETFPAVVGVALGIISVFLFMGLLIIALGAITGLGVFGALGRILIGFYRGPAFWLAKRLGVHEDRMGASYITAHNRLTKSTKKNFRAEKTLVLLPRCLSKKHLEIAKEIASEFGCPAAVAGGGTIARKLIQKHTPDAVIALACERDLVSGLGFVGTSRHVLVLSNKRPFGPCKDTEFDTDKYREMLSIFIRDKVSTKPESTD